YHWMLETLPRLMYACEQFPGMGYLIPERLLRLPYVKDTLGLWFGDRSSRTTQAKTLLCLRDAIFSRRPTKINHFDPGLIQKFRDYVRAKTPPMQEGPLKRLFVSRSNLKNRRLLNEEALHPVLKAYGFENIFFDKMSMLDQLRACQNCECLAGPHGAGLANALFLPERSSLLEIGCEVTYVPCYEHLAASLKIPYWPLKLPAACSEFVDSERVKSKYASFEVDPALLEAQFQKMGLEKLG
ncbi:MAG TPA: glycosyltransferase family 61 protein, partial [Opitutales bacterium]|nr:glycosyltransferase family 61 protein [Opitutales bacterium]